MESHIGAVLMATSQMGQTITKSTSVSIALVGMLMGATYFAGVTFASTDGRLDNIEEDLSEIKGQQAELISALLNYSPQVIHSEAIGRQEL